MEIGKHLFRQRVTDANTNNQNLYTEDAATADDDEENIVNTQEKKRPTSEIYIEPKTYNQHEEKQALKKK